MARSANIRAYMRGGFLYLLTISLPLIIIINIILGLVTPRFLVDNLGEDGAKTLELYLVSIFSISYKETVDCTLKNCNDLSSVTQISLLV